jgi:hypothetical protein
MKCGNSAFNAQGLRVIIVVLNRWCIAMMGNGMQPSLLQGFFYTLTLNVKERHKYIANQTKSVCPTL